MNIAIIDDQQEIRYSVSKILKNENHTPFQFNGLEYGLEESIEEQGVELLIVDVMLSDSLTGIDLIKQFKKHNINLPIILMTAYTTPSNMIEASKLGIKDILQKPFNQEELIELVSKHIRKPKKSKMPKPSIKKSDEEFIGSYETMKEIYRKIGVAANNDLSVLIYGETGTGKELIANLIHKNSKKEDSSIVSVNCASIPRDLFESQLFGHEKGSFTGADKQHLGLAEQAGEGTLFLDEIGELDSELQSKLLRFLESRTFRRVGGSKDILFRGRVVSATNANLKENIDKGLFREDLYFRISILTIVLPNLNERIQDLPMLCEHFIAKANKDLKTSINSISKVAIAKLKEQQWKGNIRELRNIMYSACLNAQNDKIRPEHIILLKNESKKTEVKLKELCTQFFDEEGIEKANEFNNLFYKTFLEIAYKTSPNISKLANYLNLSRNTLKKQLKEYGIYE